MHPGDDSTARPAWWREAVAGGAGALALLPVLLTLGLLAFAPLGAAAPALGLFAAFVTACLGGSVHALISRTRMPVSGPTSATALILAALVLQLAADARLAPGTAAGLQGLLALCGLAVLLSGVLQVGLALLGLARLARVVPQPVLAGFMNSAAVLIVLAQLPLLLDLPLALPPGLGLLQAANPWALALGLGTALLITLLARRWPQAPAALLGLAAGALVHALVAQFEGAPSLGAVVGPLPTAWPWPPVLLALLQPGLGGLLQAHAGPVVVTALALAAIGALESSLNVRAMDQHLNTRHDPRHELLALGCGNLACGLLGGVPLVVTRTRSLATLQAGGRGRAAALLGVAVLALVYAAGGPLLALLPLPVLAGVMLVVAVGLADRWTGRLLARWWAGDHTRELALGLGVVVLVVAVTLWQGMPAGVGLGVLLSLLVFALRMNRSLVHARYSAAIRPSRRIYPAPVEARLGPLREAITVFELDGALFFGSGDRLLDEVEALPASCRCLVLDLRRVSTVDESGAVALQQAASRLRAAGTPLLLAGLMPDEPVARALRSFGPDLPLWPDADRAVEAAEQTLLGEDADELRAMAAVPLAEAPLMAGLSPEQVAVVAALLQPRVLATGERLFAEGEPGDRLYVVGRGSVSILSEADRHGRRQRYLSVSPGMVIGETAMLDGRGRSAGAVADAPTEVHALTQQALDSLAQSHPALAVRLYRNLALHLSQRLRNAPGAWPASTR